MTTRAGAFVMQPGGYRAFVPAALPPVDLELDAELQALVSRADLAVGRRDGAADVIPNPKLFVPHYVRREAVLSSQIEGTYASLMEVLEYEAAIARAEQRVDVKETVNHILAMNCGIDRLKA